MEPAFKVGDKVIGLASWYSEPHIGTVLLANIESFDPLHDLLINVSNEALTVSDIGDYRRRLQDLSERTQLMSSQETRLHSPRTERRLMRLYDFLNSKQGRKATNYELEMKGFFQRGRATFLLRMRTYSRLCLSFVVRHAANIVLGTIELFLGDIWRFYESRLEIRKLNQQIRTESRDMRRSQYMSRVMGGVEDDVTKKHRDRIAKMRADLGSLKSEKTEISRAFIAVMISVASLIVSIVALGS